MKYRTVTIHAMAAHGTAGTLNIPIYVQDPITSLFLNFVVMIGANDRIAPEPAVVSRIAVVDGSNVILSLTGEQAVALGFYEGHWDIPYPAMNLRSQNITFNMRLYFGRFFGDPVLALDPTKFDNLQLQITYNCVLVAAGSTPIQIEVLAECFNEVSPMPIGYLRQIEHNVYTGGVTTWQYITLPTDLPLRKLYLQTRRYYTGLPTILSQVKLTEDNDKRIPFNMDDDQWSWRCFEMFGPMTQSVWMTLDNTRLVYCCPCDSMEPSIANTSAIAAVRDVVEVGGVYICQAVDLTHIGVGHMHGYLPFFTLCYPFGRQDDIDNWYDLTNVGQLELQVQSGALGAGTTYHTILQQLKRY